MVADIQTLRFSTVCRQAYYPPSDTQSLTRILVCSVAARLTEESPIAPQNQLHYSLIHKVNRRPTGDHWVWRITGQNVEGFPSVFIRSR